jgi:hypothetical protein
VSFTFLFAFQRSKAKQSLNRALGELILHKSFFLLATPSGDAMTAYKKEHYPLTVGSDAY